MQFFLSLMFFCFMNTTLHAALQPPSEDLTITIDPSQHRLTATATIHIPAQSNVTVNIEGLEIKQLTIAGVTADLAAITTKTISLDKKEYEQEIIVKYTLTCSETNRGQCLIDGTGVMLTGAWHPSLDGDTIFNLTAKIPTGFTAISEADEIKTSTEGSHKIVTFSFSHPVRSINFIAGPYQIEEETFGNNKKLLSYFFVEDQNLAASYRQKAKEYLENYIDLIGPYPYKRFAIVENRLPTGYAMPTFTLLGQSVVRLPFIVDTSLGHEVLHSWFGNAVRADRNSGNWSEGLTTYLADQSFASKKGKGWQYRKTQLVKYQNFVTRDNTFPVQDFVGASLDHGRLQQANRAIGYGKTSMFFYMLHEKYGNELFLKGLRNFYARMNGKIAKWRDIQYSFENSTSCELYDLFSQWLTRDDIPNLSIKDIRLHEETGQLLLSFTIHQETKTPYRLDVPLLVTEKGGGIKKSIPITDINTPVEIPLLSYPSEMILDPDYAIMRRLTAAEMPPVLTSFSGAQKRLVVVSSPANYDLFEPLIDMLEAEGSQILAADEVSDQDIIDNSIMFLGTSGAIPRGLFGEIKTNTKGFSLDIRKNPLNLENVAILVNTANQQEVRKAIPKLRHYGKYSLLAFANGRTIKKEIKQGETGQRYLLDKKPVGMRVTAALDFDNIIKELQKSRVIYVGESHTRYEDHKLQLRIIRELFNNDPNIVIGMEMFPRLAQGSLDQFTAGKIDEKSFIKESHYFKVWSYDYRLYRGILNFARQNKIRVIGLNIARKKVSKVYKGGGLSSLTPEEKISIPIDRDLGMLNYRQRINSVFSIHPNHGGNNQFSGFFQAQALWDETMAESIANYLIENPGKKMIVLAGKAHVIKENAIPPRVFRRIPVTQTIVMSADGSSIAPPELDFVIFTPAAKLPPPPMIGIAMKEDKENKAVIIDGLLSHGEAKKIGLKKDDILLSLDGTPISTIEEVKIIMLFKKKGGHVSVAIRRPHRIFADEKLTFEIDL